MSDRCPCCRERLMADPMPLPRADVGAIIGIALGGVSGAITASIILLLLRFYHG